MTCCNNDMGNVTNWIQELTDFLMPKPVEWEYKVNLNCCFKNSRTPLRLPVPYEKDATISFQTKDDVIARPKGSTETNNLQIHSGSEGRVTHLILVLH